jgi:hypothetical protein
MSDSVAHQTMTPPASLGPLEERWRYARQFINGVRPYICPRLAKTPSGTDS